MSRRREADQAAREERASAIRRCRRCDPCGWKLAADRTPIRARRPLQPRRAGHTATGSRHHRAHPPTRRHQRVTFMANQECTNPTARPVRADDALRYAAAKLRLLLDDEPGPPDDEADEWMAVESGAAAAQTARAVLAVLDRALDGDRTRYSDGRLVESTADFLPPGNGIVHTAHHVWHPDPAGEEPASSGAALPDDPNGRSLGFFQVMTDPATQQLRAYLVQPWRPDPTEQRTDRRA